MKWVTAANGVNGGGSSGDGDASTMNKYTWVG